MEVNQVKGLEYRDKLLTGNIYNRQLNLPFLTIELRHVCLFHIVILCECMIHNCICCGSVEDLSTNRTPIGRYSLYAVYC